MIEIVETAAMTTVQDLGRLDHYRDGVGRSGAMDGLALRIGNALLGNQPGAAAVEISLFPFRARFLERRAFAVTGADCAARLDGHALPPNWAGNAEAGEMLALGPPRSGSRAYLCVHGGVDVPTVLGSRSTQLREGFGGFEGRMLKAGDRLAVGGAAVRLPAHGIGAARDLLAEARVDGAIAVRVIPAGEYADFRPEARARLWDVPWRITPHSNRTGYRLSGPDLLMRAPREMRSHGIVPGVIQVPPGGQPIIQLADAATMGGYPKIGVVIEPDLWRLGQARPGDSLRFVETDFAAAATAREDIERYLTVLHSVAALQRAARRVS